MDIVLPILLYQLIVAFTKLLDNEWIFVYENSIP